MIDNPRIARVNALIRAASRPPPGTGRIALALALGAICHGCVAAGVLAMIGAMFFGLSEICTFDDCGEQVDRRRDARQAVSVISSKRSSHIVLDQARIEIDVNGQVAVPIRGVLRTHRLGMRL